MCYNCGCHIPQDDMGSEDNITDSTFEALAKKIKKTPEETKHYVLRLLESGETTDPHVEEIFVRASKAWGQAIPDAKKYTLELLKETRK